MSIRRVENDGKFGEAGNQQNCFPRDMGEWFSNLNIDSGYSQIRRQVESSPMSDTALWVHQIGHMHTVY